MLEAICRYAIDNGLPYEFVDYVIDVWDGLNANVNLRTIHAAWNDGERA